jgi:hypothetical protein
LIAKEKIGAPASVLILMGNFHQPGAESPVFARIGSARLRS